MIDVWPPMELKWRVTAIEEPFIFDALPPYWYSQLSFIDWLLHNAR
jgi:hypothetical protein